MRFQVSSFKILISYPALAVITLIVLSNVYTNYLLCLTAVLIHETGHLIPMFLFALKPEAFEIRAFNIKIIAKARYNTNFFRDFIITASGALFNLFAFLFFFRINIDLAYVNLFIALFNLLPASSLDGGQLIFLALSRAFSRKTTARIIDIITIITALPIFFFGILILFYSKYNFSLLIIGIYLVLSLFFREEKYL